MSKQYTKYKIETNDERELKLYLESAKLCYTLYKILEWNKDIYNGKNYGEGKILYKGKLYDKSEWEIMDKSGEERDEKGCLKEKCEHLYTEEQIMNKLDDILEGIRTFVRDYYEY